MPHRLPRPAFTLIEVILVVALLAVLTAVSLRAVYAQLDRMAVRSAVSQAAMLVARARSESAAQHARVSLQIDTIGGTVTLALRGGRITSQAIGPEHGVRLATTRDSVAFDARGLGHGAANFTLVARRNGAADTLVVSRLGRTRF